MKVEIEKKFLIDEAQFYKRVLLDNLICVEITQGYFSFDPPVRVRLQQKYFGDNSNEDPQAFITFKGKGTLSKPEFDYEIPVKDATQILSLLDPAVSSLIIKSRYLIPVLIIGPSSHVYSDYNVEVDIFQGSNKGLIIAELEVNDEKDFEYIVLPDWIKQEVTDDKRYHNAYLARCPFTTWGK